MLPFTVKIQKIFDERDFYMGQDSRQKLVTVARCSRSEDERPWIAVPVIHTAFLAQQCQYMSNQPNIDGAIHPEQSKMVRSYD